MNKKSLLHFVFELGHLRQVKHEGWRLPGVPFPESVAEHSLRAAQLGYLLACLEEYPNPHEVCAMVVFHDMAEARSGDFHRLAKRYVQVNEEQVVKDQTAPLGEVGAKLLQEWLDVENRANTAGLLAKDADELEQAVAAKEYVEAGYAEAAVWIDNVEKVLQSDSAKALLKELRNLSSKEWWKSLEAR